MVTNFVSRYPYQSLVEKRPSSSVLRDLCRRFSNRRWPRRRWFRRRLKNRYHVVSHNVG